MLSGLVMVALAAASWGTWSLFLRPTGLPANVTSPIVFAVITVAALPFARRDPPPTWDRRVAWLLVANAALDALNMVTFFGSMAMTTVAIAVLTHYAAPVLIALAAPRIDGTRVRHAGLATTIALGGLVLVLAPWRTPATGAVLGAALGLASAVCYAGNVFVVRRLATRIGPGRAVAYHAAIAALLLLPLAGRGLGAVTRHDLVLLVAGGATIGSASAVAFVAGLQRIGAARAAVLTFAEPLVAVLVGALAWGEALQPLAAIGGALVIGAGIHVARQVR